jgi:hypothetical protein
VHNFPHRIPLPPHAIRAHTGSRKARPRTRHTGFSSAALDPANSTLAATTDTNRRPPAHAVEIQARSLTHEPVLEGRKGHGKITLTDIL